jgi:hypothetical protein
MSGSRISSAMVGVLLGFMVVAITVLLFGTGCDLQLEAKQENRSSGVEAVERSAYLHDVRTDLCFFARDPRYYNNAWVLVPCTDKVLAIAAEVK